MERKSLQRALEHVSAVNITPFSEDTHEIMWAKLDEIIEFLLQNQAQVIVPGGNTGEFYSLTVDEVAEVNKRVIQTVNNRAVTIAGIGYSVKTAIDLGMRAAADGADAVLIHQPLHPYITDAGAIAYFKKIIESLPIPSVLYFRDPRLSDEVLEQLIPLENLVAVKYAINDLPRFESTVMSLRHADITWVCGTAEKWAPFFFAAGATGFTSGLMNVSPNRSLRLLDSLRAGNSQSIWQIWEDILPFETLRAKYDNGNNVIVIKEAMNRLGYSAGVTREPVGPLNDQDKAEVARILKCWGLLD